MGSRHGLIHCSAARETRRSFPTLSSKTGAIVAITPGHNRTAAPEKAGAFSLI